jgi:transposase InsO family protein
MDISSNINGISSEKFKLSPDLLCKNWCIGRTLGERPLQATTQLRVKTVASPSMKRRWPTGDRPLRYRQLDHGVYHDTMHSKIMSLQGHKCCEIYVTNVGWSRTFTTKTVSDVHETLDHFLGRYGIPEALISDGAMAYTGGDFKKKAKQAGIFCKLTDPHSPWQNAAELEIR